ncbi:hypothetical protein V6N11_081975 [Hibiscus sabdariffa]|uniref:Integrase catalytic domain-containing protein n=1 Tax=Hibiscus sabdariffa TaxID=183260 RepID=A0ABR2NWQ7_9ROSI
MSLKNMFQMNQVLMLLELTKTKFKKHMDDMVDVRCLMLATMTPELQKQDEDMVAYEMIHNLKEIYEEQARQERYETSKAFFQCKMSEGSPVGAHVIKMMGYIQALEKLGFPLNIELAIDVVLQSLPDNFNQFVLNFNMNERNKTLPQLLGMLRTAESNMKRSGSKSILMVHVAKGKGKKVVKSKGIDRGGEYLSQDFNELLKECGIVSQLTPPGTPQWNGVSERRNRTLLDMVRSMISHSDLPISFWGHALETAAFTLNHVPSKSVQKTPYEIWTGKRPKTQPLRRSTRERHEPKRYGFLVTTHGDVILVDQDEPKTYQEAVSSPDSEKWLEAMRSEMDSMSNNQVWTLVEPPEGIKPIGCKWVFKKKTDMDGNVQTYKGRLVAKAAFDDYEIWQMDVKTAFLNGKLEEDVYMTQPEGFVTLENAAKVCKLQRSIYGLKQASRSWNLRFNDAIKEFGLIRNEDEPCVYKKVSGSIISFLILYVDDILIIGNDIPTLQSIKTWLSSCFSMKDLGDATYILGVKIYRDRSRRLLGLSQSTYIDKVLKRFSMEESKRGFLPMRHGISLSKEMCPSSPQERERMSQIPYASAIGSIMYAMICTRPDLSYALSMTSRYQANPGEGHWIAVKNILKYLRRTKDVFLVYGGEEQLSIKGYTDASFQTDKDDSRSQSGFVFCLNGGAVSWKSSKQDTVADSTTEAEYIAASEAAKEAVWIKKFVTELGVVPSISDAMELYCDNNGAIAQAKEPRSHQRSKHILRRFHLIREILDRGDVEICKVHTDDNIVDPLTKPLTQQKHDRHTESLGIRYVSDWS